MRTITVMIQCDDDALIGSHSAAEAARILREAANSFDMFGDIATWDVSNHGHRILKDHNGNAVGSVITRGFDRP